MIQINEIIVVVDKLVDNISTVNFVAVPPSLISSAENATRTVGEFVRFQCSFYGIPQPDVHWFYVSGGSTVQLTQTARYFISAGNLQITQLKKRDEGKYICRAVSIAGRTESSAYLNVKGTTLVEVCIHELGSPLYVSSFDTKNTCLQEQGYVDLAVLW